MEPVVALGIASNIIQLVDFSSRLISRGHELYQSADGRTEHNTILENATDNLSELYNDLSCRTIFDPSKATAADKQIIALQKESAGVAQKLKEALNKAKRKDGNKKWRSIHQAICSVHSDRTISKLADQLDHIRKQIDTILLVSLRQSMEQTKDSPTQRLFEQRNSFRKEAEQKQAELLHAIHENSWHASHKDDVQRFSTQLNSYAAAASEARFTKMILARLYFPVMSDRGESISSAYSETFEWLFNNEKDQGEASGFGDSFSKWLQEEDSSVYWITGKPGSGKSTLMKFIYSHDGLSPLLKKWASRKDLVKAGFYFWNSGTVMQMSRLGYFQSILHGCLQQHRDLVVTAFPERWEQFVAFGGGHDPFSWLDLRRAFKNVISVQTKNFFFLIDGLDEFDGEPKEVIELILDTVQSNVKMCVSSRPWLQFEDAFDKRPNLRLERLTHKDISIYVAGHFDNNEHYSRFRLDNPAAASTLLADIADRAHGVFLWVYLVVQSLLEGLVNSDRLLDLRTRLDALPSGLESLFDKLLCRLQPEYFRQACEMFRLLRAHREVTSYVHIIGSEQHPTLLGLYFADDVNSKSSLQATCTNAAATNTSQEIQIMRRRLNARCNCFLEIRDDIKEESTNNPWVAYLHRTARDFVESEIYWHQVLQTTNYHSFKAEERWANAYLWLLKVGALVSEPMMRIVYTTVTFLIHGKPGTVQKTYLDEFCRAIRFHDAGLRRETLLCTQLDVVMLVPELAGYLAISLERLSCNERRKDLKQYVYTMEAIAEDLRPILEYYSKPPPGLERLKWLCRRPKRPSLPPYE
ncbi:hypothetical protein BKA66DRAFT_612717 [Pyrenochaeta sp. MPI-SDFR-AT-0127]|nr:hypothetical protein BKA66DRAFT_612717 [Pyrenochaeta sp. MPI-SDFR-AT-0127]